MTAGFAPLPSGSCIHCGAKTTIILKTGKPARFVTQHRKGCVLAKPDRTAK